MDAQKEKRKSGIFRLLEISGNRKQLLLVSGLTVCLHALLTMIPYVLIFYILQELLNSNQTIQIENSYLKWMIIATIVSFLMMFISGATSHLAAFNILYELRTSIAEKIGKLSMGYLNTRNSGALKKILADDVERIETFIAHGIPDTIKAVALPVITLIFLFTIDWRLAAISIIPLILVMVFMSVYMGGEKTKQGMQHYHQSLEEMNAGIIEFVRAMPVMKIFGQTASAFKKYNDSVENFRHFVNQWTKISSPAWGMIMSFLTNALLPVLALGLYLFFNHQLNTAVFVLFLILGVGYIKPMFALTTLSTQIVMINHGVQRIDEILFEIKEPESGTQKTSDDYSVSFNSVSFSYTPSVKVLDNISFQVPQGSITALVGPSGSGKSTIAQLIPRFYDIEQGEIKIGNIPIKEIDQENLMENVSFVFQDNMMFYDTLLQNILMGMDKTKEEVIEAAKKARCHDFIMQLPQGYDTHFGDKGVHLSGGEQQRIQLARVVLKDAPILILDEATAFSDPENEQQIMQAFGEIIRNKTVLVIAHRLSTITEVDQIIVLEKGKINARGSHAQLLQESALYQTMWNAHNRANEFEIINRKKHSSIA